MLLLHYCCTFYYYYYYYYHYYYYYYYHYYHLAWLHFRVMRVGVEDAQLGPERGSHRMQPDLRCAAAAALAALGGGAMCGVAGVGADRKALGHSVGRQHLRAQRRWGRRL